MLTCLYHPIDGMTVFEDWEVETKLASGVWFDSPKKASEYRDNVERQISEESKPEVMTLELKKELKNERKR